jgi:hypothetical protein
VILFMVLLISETASPTSYSIFTRDQDSAPSDSLVFDGHAKATPSHSTYHDS